MVWLCPAAVPAQGCETWVAQVVSVQGTVETQRGDETPWQPVKVHNTYCPGERIRVQDRSRADVVLGNQAVLRLSANTLIILEGVQEDRTALVRLLKGAVHALSRGPHSLEVRTPFAVAGARGTEFFIRVADDQVLLSVFVGYEAVICGLVLLDCAPQSSRSVARAGGSRKPHIGSEAVSHYRMGVDGVSRVCPTFYTRSSPGI
jgi:hypothetical protein